MTNCVLIVKELDMHPNSVVTKLTSRFEVTSVVDVTSADQVSAIKKPPIFNNVYVLLITSMRVLTNSISNFKLDIELPVFVCSNEDTMQEARSLCLAKNVPYKLLRNPYTKEDATAHILSLVRGKISDECIKKIISRTGLSPRRIISAVAVLDEVGYTVKNVEKYIDKYRRVDIYDTVSTLLGVASGSQINRCMLNLKQSMYWFRRYKSQLLSALKEIQSLYLLIMDGKLSADAVSTYSIEEGYPMYKLKYAINLFDKVSYVTLKAVTEQAAVCRNTLELALLCKRRCENKLG